jgi:hypothetical protein
VTEDRKKNTIENKTQKDSDHVVIKFKRADLADDEGDLEIVKLIEGASDPGFELPAILKWPKGERRNGERALLLLRAGLEHLRERYPLKRRQGAQGNGTIETCKSLERSTENQSETQEDFKGW